MNKSSGTDKLNQKRISQLHTTTHHTFTVEEAATILKMPVKAVAKLMSRWVEQGWFSRIKRGLYISIKQDEMKGSDDPWITATKIYHPCYIGALNAAEYWGLTNQNASNVSILTTKKPKNRKPVLNHVSYFVRTVPEQAMFGLVPIMRGQVEVLVSDASRTIIDFMLDPQLGAGICNVIDILTTYLNSEHKNMDLLLSYANRFCKGAVVKRMGYLLERCKSGEFNTIYFCKNLTTSGHIKLDPKMDAEKLITRWGLWVPSGWERKKIK
jgi:predicted transcriptional regulator of viral defense system